MKELGPATWRTERFGSRRLPTLGSHDEFAASPRAGVASRRSSWFISARRKSKLEFSAQLAVRQVVPSPPLERLSGRGGGSGGGGGDGRRQFSVHPPVVSTAHDGAQDGEAAAGVPGGPGPNRGVSRVAS